MKANELMIGDWVQDITPVVIDAISNEDICTYRAEQGYVTANPSNLKPIPLTAEILEKNEWRCFNSYHKYSHPKAPFDIRQQKDGGYTIEVDADEYGSAVFLFIRYVHELQHALKLCGIDKEIVL